MTILYAWSRVTDAAMCGSCGRSMEIDDPIMVISKDGQKWKLKRCQTCAGEPVPPDLPDQRPQQRGIEPRPLRRLGAVPLPFDAKLAAVGEREPGEEG